MSRDPANRADTALWAAAWVLLAANLFFSFGPAPPGAGVFPHADKLLHLASYGLAVGAFLFAAVWRPGRGEGRFPWGSAIVLGAAVALATVSEILQGAVFGRDAEVLDGLADFLGIAFAYGAWRAMRSAAAS